MKDPAPRWPLVLIVAIGAVLRLATWPHLSFSGDESWTLRWIQQPVHVLLTHFEVGLSMHLYLLLLKGWAALAGLSEYALKAPSLLFSVLALPVFYRYGRRWISTPAALTAVVLMACSPALIEYARAARVYALLVLVAPFQMAAFLHAVRAARRAPWAALGAANAVAMMLSGNSSYLMIVQGVVLVIEALREPARRRELLTAFTLSSLLALALTFAFYAATLPALLRLVRQWTGGASSHFGSAALTWRALHPTAPALLLLLTGLGSWTAWRARTLEARMLLAWVWVPPLVFILIGTRHPPESLARFLLPVVPAQFLLIGCWVAALARRGAPARVALASGALAALLGATTLAGSARARSMLLQEPLATRPAVERLRALATPTDLVTARTDWHAWILHNRLPARVREWPDLVEKTDRATYNRLLAMMPVPPQVPASWSAWFTTETVGGPAYLQDVLLLVSRPLATPAERRAAVRAWLEGLIEIIDRETRAPPGRRHAEQALLTLGLSRLAAAEQDAAGAERLRLEADALMRQAEREQRARR